ncbi:MAG: MBL fold metallo-hydrolase, partial [Planctomycetes bacterium]|nr:MBL fold metallo-hydrolase [Planctomycetota bacterium]
MIGCDCPVCTSSDPRDKRNRASVAIQLPANTPAKPRVILIDTPPEFRLAAIANDLKRVDAVLVTHAHADHILGMDDLRRYNRILGTAITCRANAEAIAILRTIFHYAEGTRAEPGRPRIVFEPIQQQAQICGATVIPIPLAHDKQQILGFRIGRFAYCTDCSGIPQASKDLLAGLDLLVLGALRYSPHPAHFNLDQALEVIKQLRPNRTLLTHIAHEMSHATLMAQLPANVEPAYDG